MIKDCRLIGRRTACPYAWLSRRHGHQVIAESIECACKSAPAPDGELVQWPAAGALDDGQRESDAKQGRGRLLVKVTCFPLPIT